MKMHFICHGTCVVSKVIAIEMGWGGEMKENLNPKKP
jgi:hypothetical protein